MFVLSLLNQRILAVMRGAVIGEALGSKEYIADGHGTILGTLTWFVESIAKNQGNVRQIFTDDRIVCERSMDAEAISFYVPGLAIPIGIIKRPQDHNGVVDDIVTAIMWSEPTKGVAAGACALAAAVAGLLDGWSLEGALDLALFVGKRGETFGSPHGMDIVGDLEKMMEAVEDGAVNGLMALQPRFNDAEDQGLAGIIPFALSLAYAYRDVEGLVETIKKLDDIAVPIRRCIASISVALCAAENPSLISHHPIELNLPGENSSVAYELAAIRWKRWDVAATLRSMKEKESYF